MATPPSSTATPDTTTPPTTTGLRYVLPAGGELTERQAEMVTVVGQYIEAIRANDGDGAATFMTQDAYLEYPELDGIFRVSDGALQERFRLPRPLGGADTGELPQPCRRIACKAWGARYRIRC